jgi:hypothetical protein
MQSGLHWTDRLFNQHQDKEAPPTYGSWTPRQVSRGRAQYQLEAIYSTIQETWTASSGKWSSLSSTTVQTDRIVSVSSHGNPSPAAWKKHRKSPSQDSRAGFSVGPCISIYTAPTRAPTLPFPSALSLYTPVPASLDYFCSFNLYHMARTNVHDFFLILLSSWPTTPLLFSPIFS